MQNRIHYLRWTAGLIVVTNSFLTGTKNDKYGTIVNTQAQIRSEKEEMGPRPYSDVVFFSLVGRTAQISYSSRILIKMADVVEIHGGNDFEDDTEGDRKFY